MISWTSVVKLINSNSVLGHKWSCMRQSVANTRDFRAEIYPTDPVATAGFEAARQRGRVGGRPRAISSEKRAAILEAVDYGMSNAAVCRTFGLRRTTLLESLVRLRR